MKNYLTINKNLWDAKTDIHVESAFYDVKGFLNGKEILNEPELELLGNISGKSILHLQCHFGMDSLALAQKGAKVTGIDLSSKAISKAKELNEQLQLNAKFIEADLYSLPSILDEKFDIVYTSYGVIGWLPDLEKWASVVSNFIKPGGKFVMVEFHPVVWMLDEEFTHIKYFYFNREAIIETEEGTYTNREANIKETSISWNHDLGAVLGALIHKGINIEEFKEFDYSCYNCFPKTVQIEENKFQIEGLEGKLPIMFSLLGAKK